MRFVVVLVLLGLSPNLAGCKSASDSQVKDSLVNPSRVLDECAIGFDPYELAQDAAFRDNFHRLRWDVFLASARASNLVYSAPVVIKNIASAWGYTRVDVIEDNGLAVFVASNDQCALVSFRGTDEIRDWLTNTNLLGTSVSRGRIHSGFYGGYNRLRTRLLVALKTHADKKKKLWITGHSLGGALAGVMLHDFATTSGSLPPALNLEYVVTFGQPLFADEGLATFLGQHYRKRFFRIVNGKDIVARVPYGYSHFGSLVWQKQPDLFAYRPQLDASVVLSTASAAPATLSTASPNRALPLPEDEVIDWNELEPDPQDFADYMEGYRPRAQEVPDGARSSKPNSDDPVPLSTASASPASISYVDDHSMRFYADFVRAQLRRARSF